MPLDVIDGVKLSTEQYDEYIQFYSGKNNKFVDKPLHTALRDMMRTSQYKTDTDGQEGGKSLLIRAVFEGYRTAAKQMMLEKDRALSTDIVIKKTTQAQKLGAK
jgi:aminopeptidase C